MERAQRKVRSGKVVSDKMDKTVVVSVEITERHPIYKKTFTSTKKYKAHDENNEARVGDTVTIMETRHLSKDKCWRLVEITQRAIAL
ncbi:MAG: 30S ribosomal protein S17 [Bacillota bacterium]|nr:30S ribosomal protein S17 [Bacillota bacterium]MDP4158268.1 30S ribosomal protein S17 [Bacillota bacterium]